MIKKIPIFHRGFPTGTDSESTFAITVVEPKNLNGYKLVVDVQGLKKTFSGITANVPIQITYSAAQTKSMKAGLTKVDVHLVNPLGGINQLEPAYVMIDPEKIKYETQGMLEGLNFPRTGVKPTEAYDAIAVLWHMLGGRVDGGSSIVSGFISALVLSASLLFGSSCSAFPPPGTIPYGEIQENDLVVTNAAQAVTGDVEFIRLLDGTYMRKENAYTKSEVYTKSETDELIGSRRDKTDLKVYRRVKDCWTWKNWSNPQEPLAKEAPDDFLALANSPGSVPIRYERVAGAWFGAVQFWPNGKVKYSQSEIPPGGTGEFSTRVNFAMYAYDETGTNELFRFGATATRTDPTNETIVAWDGTRNEYIRIATTDMVDGAIRRQVAATTNGIRRIDGEARMLPPYLHVLSFDDGYPADAEWYFDQIDRLGYCSSARRGDTYVRNYDWRYDESATFVIRMSAASNRFASVSIASVGTNLTEAIVTSGAWSRYYRCLPGHTLDGINEMGLVCNINVVTTNGSPWESHLDGDGRTLNILGACRYLLDNYSCASNAAAYVAAHAYVPVSLQKLGDSIHLMVADEHETWIVEDGVAHLLTPEIGAYMTNFRRFNPNGTTPANDPYGAGFERAAILSDPSHSLFDGLTNAWYTHTYRRLPDDSFPWPTEFAGMVDADGAIPNTETNRLQQWAKENVPDIPMQRGLGWWQTVHSTCYDIPSRTMRVAVQEKNDWYVFQIPSFGGSVKPETVREIVKPMIADATNAVPRIVMGDLEVRADLTAKVQSGWTDQWEPNQSVPYPLNVGDKRYYGIAFVDVGAIQGWYCMADEWDGEDWIPLSDEHLSFNRDATELTFPDGTVTHRVPATRETKLATTNDIVSAIENKRDLDDRQWGDRTFSAWVLYSTDFPDSTICWFDSLDEYLEAYGIESEWEGPGWYINKGVGPGFTSHNPDPFALMVGDNEACFTRTETTDHLAIDSEVDAKLARKSDEFTAWKYEDGYEVIPNDITYDEERNEWVLFFGSDYYRATGTPDDVRVHFIGHGDDFYITRRRVLRTGDTVPRIVMDYSEVNADLTVNLWDGKLVWEPNHTQKPENPMFLDNYYENPKFNESVGRFTCDWYVYHDDYFETVWEYQSQVPMNGASENPHTEELYFPDGTQTRLVPVITKTKLATTNDVSTAALALSKKRDLTEMCVYEPMNEHWVWTSDDAPDGWLEKANAYGAPKPYWSGSPEPYYWFIGHIGGYSITLPSGVHQPNATELEFNFSGNGISFDAIATRRSATNTIPVVVDTIAPVSQLPPDKDIAAWKNSHETLMALSNSVYSIETSSATVIDVINAIKAAFERGN